tara:strand:+ start:531 stop:1208 length:678 start_codon:yes stop_codon:yes gene_type:complete
MPGKISVYSGSNDGYRSLSGGSWGACRGTAFGGSLGGSNTATGTAYNGSRASVSAGRGGTTYFLSRSFFEFDTRTIIDLPEKASIDIYNYVFDNSGFRFVKSTQDGTLSSDDFNEIPGITPSDSNGSGGDDSRLTVTAYTDTTTTSMTSGGFTKIWLNQQALVDIQAFGTFKFAMVDWEKDIRDVTPTSATNYTGVFYSEYAASSRDPVLTVFHQANSIFFGANF